MATVLIELDSIFIKQKSRSNPIKYNTELIQSLHKSQQEGYYIIGLTSKAFLSRTPKINLTFSENNHLLRSIVRELNESYQFKFNILINASTYKNLIIYIQKACIIESFVETEKFFTQLSLEERLKYLEGHIGLCELNWMPVYLYSDYKYQHQISSKNGNKISSADYFKSRRNKRHLNQVDSFFINTLIISCKEFELDYHKAIEKNTLLMQCQSFCDKELQDLIERYYSTFPTNEEESTNQNLSNYWCVFDRIIKLNPDSLIDNDRFTVIHWKILDNNIGVILVSNLFLINNNQLINNIFGKLGIFIINYHKRKNFHLSSTINFVRHCIFNIDNYSSLNSQSTEQYILNHCHLTIAKKKLIDSQKCLGTKNILLNSYLTSLINYLNRYYSLTNKQMILNAYYHKRESITPDAISKEIISHLKNLIVNQKTHRLNNQFSSSISSDIYYLSNTSESCLSCYKKSMVIFKEALLFAKCLNDIVLNPNFAVSDIIKKYFYSIDLIKQYRFKSNLQYYIIYLYLIEECFGFHPSF